MPAIDPATLRRPDEPAPPQTTAAAQPYRDVTRELDEMSLVLEVDKLRAEAARGVAADESTVIMPAPRERVEANRRMTFAALRALPARASSLPPPPPRRIDPAPAPAPDAIRGMPIIAVGEPVAEPMTAPAVPPMSAPMPPPMPMAMPEQYPAAIAYQPPMFSDAGRAPFPSVPPTTYSIATEEPPPPSLHQRRASRLRIAVACTVWAALLGGAALVATGHLGQPPEPQAMATPEAASPPARAAAKPAAPPVAAPEPPAAPQSEAASVDDLPDEPAKAAPVQAPVTKAASRRNAASTAPQKNHEIQIDSLFYGHTNDDRSVTLQIDGKEVIVREGDVADDLQVENILPDGVVFKRGNRRFAVYKK